ncbi:MAG: hypothetical protein H7A31_04790 [Thermotogae bacterium]|nr:hypothetical protein [Thermotogota bacterium]MCP5465994.1 hypothetical protein [Thermotogota bacterium]HOO74730.1 hypothetical protein [Tepiditoga sp.]
MKKIIKNQERFWRFSFFIYSFLVFFLSVAKPLVDYNTFTGEDKIVHTVAYFIYSDIFCMGFIKIKNKFFYYGIFLAVISVPVISEYVQAMTPYHIFSVRDMIFSFLGIILGFVYYGFKYFAFER